MSQRPRWILELRHDFPSAEQLLPLLDEPVVIEQTETLLGRWPRIEGPVVGYGGMAAMTRLGREPSLGLAVFDDYPKLKCSSYYRWVYDLLGRTCVIVPFSALPHLPLERLFGSAIFLRSDSNFKLFPAQVHRLEDLPLWTELQSAHLDELVVLAEPIEIESEYRCFCREGRFFCGSSYPNEPYSSVPTEARELAEIAAGRLWGQGIAMCTVDVARSGHRWLLVELGGVNSWGIYGSDPQAFIAAMEAEAERVYSDFGE